MICTESKGRTRHLCISWLTHKLWRLLKIGRVIYKPICTVKQIAIPETYLSFYVSSFITDNRVKQLLAFFFFWLKRKNQTHKLWIDQCLILRSLSLIILGNRDNYSEVFGCLRIKMGWWGFCSFFNFGKIDCVCFSWMKIMLEIDELLRTLVKSQL